MQKHVEKQFESMYKSSTTSLFYYFCVYFRCQLEEYLLSHVTLLFQDLFIFVFANVKRDAVFYNTYTVYSIPYLLEFAIQFEPILQDYSYSIIVLFNFILPNKKVQ